MKHGEVQRISKADEFILRRIALWKPIDEAMDKVCDKLNITHSAYINVMLESRPFISRTVFDKNWFKKLANNIKNAAEKFPVERTMKLEIKMSGDVYLAIAEAGRLSGLGIEGFINGAICAEILKLFKYKAHPTMITEAAHILKESEQKVVNDYHYGTL